MAKTFPSLLEKSILGLVLLLANLRALMFVFLFPNLSNPLGIAWIEILLWVLATIGVVYLLVHNRQLSLYLAMWRKNWLILLFIGLAFLSILWSAAPLATIFRSMELVLATLIAAYFGFRFLPEQMMEVLFWFGTVLFILSIALVYSAPPTGTMYWPPFSGAWRGIYWHRNHLASIAALLNAVFLIRILIAVQNRNRKGILDGLFYFFSVLILFFTRSATGYILWIVLNVFVWGSWVWLRLSGHLKKWHYFLILALGALVTTLILSNLGSVFRLFNRSTTLTGRTPLWEYLLEVAYRRLWTGHGFGALWTLDSFRDDAMRNATWSSQPLIADNGFLDLFLHLGIIGLLVFLSVLVLFAIRAVRYGITEKTLASFFPLLIVVYAFFANLSFSLFVETEVFVWFLIVTALFMTTSSTETTVK